MSKYYGILKGSRKIDPTTRAHHGITSYAASYEGAIKTEIYPDKETGRDRYTVTLIDWPSRNVRKVIAEGFVDAKPAKRKPRAKPAGIPCASMHEFDKL